MASPNKMFMIIAIVAVSVPSILATEHLVGDATGWKPGFDYGAWANGKEFHVGDTLGTSSISAHIVNSSIILILECEVILFFFNCRFVPEIGFFFS